jgi:glycosyltransferase involved in cell wall biosynthesis
MTPKKPAATVAVVPRETLSQVKACLETLVTNTVPPYRLVVVDGCYPKRTRRWLDAFARHHDATLLRADRPLNPNEARNAALAYVDTKYVVFLDDNAFVRRGWLEALIRCANETGAAIVGPIYGFRSSREGAETVHAFDGKNHIVEVDGGRYHIDETFNARMSLAEAEANLPRMPSEVAEFHCMLARCDLFHEVGPLDEQLRSTSDHMDVCMLARDAGHEVWLEPESVVVYELPLPLPLRDRPFFVLRWSDDWNRASEDRFAAKWRLSVDDPSVDAMLHWATGYRRIAYWLSPKKLERAFKKLVPGAVPRVDELVQRLVVRRYDRQRVRSRGVRLVRAASWYGRSDVPKSTAEQSLSSRESSEVSDGAD